MPAQWPEPGPGAGQQVLAGELERVVPEPMSIHVAAVEADAEVELSATKRLGIAGWFAIAWMVFVIGSAILAPVLPIDDPIKGDLLHVRASPGEAGHLLGTDDNGRDVLARTIWGSRTSLLVGLGAIVIGFAVGGVLGLMAGYLRGRTDTVLSTLFDVLLAFPPLVLALALVTALASGTVESPVGSGQRLAVLILALGIVSIPVLARITRATTMAWSQREFVTAARAQGAKTGRIVVREVLPNVLPAMFSIALLGVAVVIVVEGGLAILGVGVQLPMASWGNMIAEARGNLEKIPWAVFTPSAFIFLTVLSLNFLGDVVRARFDVRESAL